jgi:hypothetical protein
VCFEFVEPGGPFPASFFLAILPLSLVAVRLLLFPAPVAALSRRAGALFVRLVGAAFSRPPTLGTVAALAKLGGEFGEVAAQVPRQGLVGRMDADPDLAGALDHAKFDTLIVIAGNA